MRAGIKTIKRTQMQMRVLICFISRIKFRHILFFS